MVDLRRPPIIDVRYTNASVLPYTTDGHYVNISSYSDYYGQLRITDPFGSMYGNTWYSTDGIHKINNNHNRKAIIVW